MTSLGCNVMSCCHNTDSNCCLGSIHIHGLNAKECTQTSCGSYHETDSSTKNSTASPKITLSISCDADHCIYNTNKKCSAEHVDISGICASCADETVCSSFKCKDC